MAEIDIHVKPDFKLRSPRHQFHSFCQEWLADQIMSQDVGLGRRTCQMKLLCKFPWPLTFVSRLHSLMDELGKFVCKSALSIKLDQMGTG